MLIKAAFALMLLFPLIALAVVLIVRIGYLWIIIAASPFLILKKLFNDQFKDIAKNFSLENIISLVFSPVITVFALSISLIFMTTLIKSYSPSNDGTTVQSSSMKSMGIEQTTPTNGGDQSYLI